MLRIVQQLGNLVLSIVKFLTAQCPQGKIGFNIVVTVKICLPLGFVRKALVGQLRIFLHMIGLVIAITHAGPHIKCPNCTAEAKQIVVNAYFDAKPRRADAFVAKTLPTAA